MRGAECPFQLEVALARIHGTLKPTRASATLHGRAGTLVSEFLDEPAVDPLCRVPLLFGAPRLVSSIDPIASAHASVAERDLSAGTGAAKDISFMSAYLTTALRLRRSLLAISALEPPGIQLAHTISHIQGHGHLFHPSRAALAKVRARENHMARAVLLGTGYGPTCTSRSILGAQGAYFPIHN